MSHLKFNYVFAGLMALSVFSAFVAPRRIGDWSRAQIQGIFAPVARPVRMLAGSLYDRIAGTQAAARDDGAAADGSPRPSAEIIAENHRLRLIVANLTARFDELQERDANRRKVGAVLDLCRPFAVSGTDPGPRQSLVLAGTSLEGLRVAMPVLYPGGIAGRISRAGVAGAQVQLVTDHGFRVLGSFARFRNDPRGNVEFVNVDFPVALIEGVGNGMMRSQRLSHARVREAGLRPGDWVILNDNSWPAAVQGYRLGKIEAINQQPESPLFDEIRITPAGNLLLLREVMVMIADG
jgi:cell shape-determining protein MreC